MAKKKATVQQTAAKRVLDVLHRKEAYSESTAVGYEAFKNISYPTQVIACLLYTSYLTASFHQRPVPYYGRLRQ